MFKNRTIAEQIRQTAYFLWEHDGRPEGAAMDCWLRAKRMHQRQIAYDRWLAEGAPGDRSEVHWSAAEQDLNAE